MLAQANRIVTADDYRRVVRRGRRVHSEHSMLYVSGPVNGAPVRFGFIVPKSVGVAVKRNLVRRRLKALCREAMPTLVPGSEIVIRALPGAAQVSWGTLRTEISASFDRSVRQA